MRRQVVSVISHFKQGVSLARTKGGIGDDLGVVLGVEHRSGQIRIVTTRRELLVDSNSDLAINARAVKQGDHLSIFGADVGCDTLLVGTLAEQIEQAERGISALQGLLE